EHFGGGRHSASAGQSAAETGNQDRSALGVRGRDSHVSHARRNRADGGCTPGENFNSAEFFSPQAPDSVYQSRAPGAECECPGKLCQLTATPASGRQRVAVTDSRAAKPQLYGIS